MMRIVTSTLAAIALVLGVAAAAAPPAPAGESTPIAPIMEPTGRAQQDDMQLDGAQQDSTPAAGAGGYDIRESTTGAAGGIQQDTGSGQQDMSGVQQDVDSTGVPVDAPAVESPAEDTSSTRQAACLHPMTGERIECSEDTPDGVLVIAVPCETDDGTVPAGAMACWWDSSVQGNGIGVSYIIYRTR